VQLEVSRKDASIVVVSFHRRILFSAGFVHRRPRGHIIIRHNKGNIAFLLFSPALSKAKTYYNAGTRTFPPSTTKPSNANFTLETRTTVHRSSPQQHQQQPKDMISSIFISALLAGPVVAGVIPRQNTITVKQIVTSVIATSTVLEHAPSGKPAAYSYSPFPSPSTLPLNIPNGFAAELGLNPINGLPAAPPQKAKCVTTTAPAPSSTTIRPIVFSTINGSLQALYKSGLASTFAVPAPSSSSPVPKKLGSSASSTAPLVFRTFTSAKGDAPPTATNSPKPTKSAASSPTLTRLIQTSSAPAPSSKAALPSAYSSLSRAPPQFFPTVVISKKPVPEKTSTVPSSSSKPTTTSSKAPAPAPPAPTETKTEDDDAIPSDLAVLFSSSEEATNPYPYPTAQPKKPKPSNFTYPYPPKN
jgi:hypothetical protein